MNTALKFIKQKNVIHSNEINDSSHTVLNKKGNVIDDSIINIMRKIEAK